MREFNQQTINHMDLITANENKPLFLTVPVRNKSGGLATFKDSDGIEKVAMIDPAVYTSLGLPLHAPLHENKHKALAIFKECLEQGKAKLSAKPYTTEQAAYQVKKATNSQRPYEETWQMIDRIIRETDNSQDDNEMMFLRTIGLVENSLMWGDIAVKNIIRNPLKLRSNQRYGFTEINPSALNEGFSVQYGQNLTDVPIVYNTFITSTRVGSAVSDSISAGDAARSTVLQRNFNALFGAGGISLTDPGNYWDGLLNHSQTDVYDNTLGGLIAPPGLYMNNADDIETLLKFVKKTFVDSLKYGNFAAMFGSEIVYELATTITDNKTDSFTLGQVLVNIAETLNGGQTFDWSVSYKLPPKDALFIIRDTRYNQFKSGGGLTVIELANNALGRNAMVYAQDVFIAPGDGVAGNISIIYVTDLLP